MNTESQRPGARRVPDHRRVLKGLVVMGVAAVMTAGCNDPSEQCARLAEAFERVAAGSQQDVVRFVLGRPARRTDDRRSWWYVQPTDAALTAGHGGASVVVRFDTNGELVSAELIRWENVKGSTWRLQAERRETINPRVDEGVDLAAILSHRLAELARAGDAYRFEQQPASYQLLAGDQLLLAMERWTSGPTRWTRMHGVIDAEPHPQVVRAVSLSCQIRRFTTELWFEPAPPGRGDE